MRKVCVVLTARTSYAKIRPILAALRDRSDVELQLICAASAVLERYGQVERVVEADGFVVSERIYMVLEAETLLTATKSTGIGIVEFAGAFDRLKPDVVLVMADRYEILAPAVAASYQNIPLAHVQGGEVSGNIDEKVRHAVTKLADIHFPATRVASEWLLKMGERSEHVHWVGCPSIDLASEAVRTPELGFDLYEKYGGVGERPCLGEGFVIVMQHSVTTEFESARSQIVETLEAVRRWDRPAIWFWPNPDAGSDDVSKVIRGYREKDLIRRVHFVKNMAPMDFLRLLNKSEGIVGNSSVAIREGAYLGVPAVNVGTRQSCRERGPNVVDVGYRREDIFAAMTSRFGRRVQRSVLYGEGDSGRKIASVLAKCQLTYSKTLAYAEAMPSDPVLKSLGE